MNNTKIIDDIQNDVEMYMKLTENIILFIVLVSMVETFKLRKYILLNLSTFTKLCINDEPKERRK